MPCFFQIQLRFLYYFGPFCTHLYSQGCASKGKGYVGYVMVIQGNQRGGLGTFGGKRGENSLDFMLLHSREALKLVVCLHDSHRLNKERGT